MVFFAYKKKITAIDCFFTRSILYLLIFILIVTAWAIRTKISVNDENLKSGQRAAINLMNGLYPEYYEDFAKGIINDPNHPMNQDITKTGGSVTKAFSIILEKVKNDPARFLKWYLIEKPLIFWSWDIRIGVGDVFVYPFTQSIFDISLIWKGIKNIYKVINPALFLVYLYGLVLIIRSSIKNRSLEIFFISMAFLLVAYATAIYTVFQTDPRYSVPFRPLFYSCVVWVIYEFKRILINKDIK